MECALGGLIKPREENSTPGTLKAVPSHWSNQRLTSNTELSGTTLGKIELRAKMSRECCESVRLIHLPMQLSVCYSEGTWKIAQTLTT